jgi:hypothetical protein
VCEDLKRVGGFSPELGPEVANIVCDHCGNAFQSVHLTRDNAGSSECDRDKLADPGENFPMRDKTIHEWGRNDEANSVKEPLRFAVMNPIHRETSVNLYPTIWVVGTTGAK